MLESGNPEATVRNIGAVFLTETPQQIPAFAGMTKSSRVSRFLHTLETGNGDVVSGFLESFAHYPAETPLRDGTARFPRTIGFFLRAGRGSGIALRARRRGRSAHGERR